MSIRKNPFLAYINDFEAEAENFLRKYKCEDAITDPQPIPIDKIALRYMSLGIINTECLSPDGSVQGAITFAKGIVDVYDWNSGSMSDLVYLDLQCLLMPTLSMRDVYETHSHTNAFIGINIGTISITSVLTSME